MEFNIGDQVTLVGPQRYLKTADAMPVLRPPDLVSVTDIGEIVELRANGNAAVRFRRGVFLIALEQLALEGANDRTNDSSGQQA
ncbi:NAD(P)H dehydrogenase assembly family protein [Prochlorococcus sp. MIT 1300]|uniref:NAD(P)H dehydrogenase assembly family protein n=1 Tax=Prochlorococcus sp. MIT 1300 TaxID=3096218 RepID=UPI002A761017|nr:NAD(P)H dehydrogenase assembly family protein [Prochlorococcus sp. MIT 1300]